MDEKDYEKIKAEYEASTDEKLVEWARPYFEGTKKPDSKDKYIVCPVSERAAQDIFELTGSDVNGFNHVLRCDEVKHVDKRHGKKGVADHSMSDINDLGRMAYVLSNYDYIETDGKPVFGFTNKSGQAAALIRYVKRIDGHVYTAAAVTDSTKRKTLTIQSMYKAKTSAFMTQKKELTATAPNEPSPYVQDDVNSTTNILPQSDKNVKPSEQKSPLETRPLTPREQYEAMRDKMKSEGAAKPKPLSQKNSTKEKPPTHSK